MYFFMLIVCVEGCNKPVCIKKGHFVVILQNIWYYMQ